MDSEDLRALIAQGISDPLNRISDRVSEISDPRNRLSGPDQLLSGPDGALSGALNGALKLTLSQPLTNSESYWLSSQQQHEG